MGYAPAMSAEAESVRITTAEGSTLEGELFAPRGDDRRTLVIMVHGGAWQVGDRSMMHPRAQALAAHGFTCVAVRYRLLGEAPWPAPLDDVVAWCRWARSEAEARGIDSVALLGCSAGAHLSLLAAASSDPDAPNADAVIALYPPASLTAEQAARLIGDDASPEAIAAVSPQARVTSGFPPTMLIHGTADAMVPVSQSVGLHQVLQDSGVPSELHLMEGQIHEFDTGPTYLELVQHMAAVFLHRRLVDPDRFDAEQRDHNPVYGRG